MSDFDYMEIGESGWYGTPDGWFEDTHGRKRSPEGRVFDEHGNVLYDETTEDDEDYERD